jgi:hypothetical protein
MKGWLDKYQEGGKTNKWDNGLTAKQKAQLKVDRESAEKDIEGTALKALDQVMSYPQRKVTELITGTNQYPSEAMGITNPYGAFAVNAIADPVNLVGAGLLGKFAKNKAFKLNPRAFKPNPEAYYHRSPDLKQVINRETGMLQGFGKSEAGKAYSELAYGKGPEVVKNIGTTNEYISTINLKKPANSQLYFAKGTPLDYGRYNPSGQGYTGPYMIEAEGIPMGASTKGRRPKASPPKYIEGYATAHRPISADEVKFYKEHWWQGYKPIEVPKKEDGGWLDKYNDGGPIQPNYNDYSASAGPGFEGDGTFNKGRNYSPAWGGQFADGGELPNITVKGKRQPIVVTDPNDPRLKAYKDSLSLYNESKNAEAKIANVFASGYKKGGFNKSTVDKTIFEGKDIVVHPEKYTKREKGYIDSKLKKYNKKGIYGESYPGEKYLGTPQYPATIQNLIQYNTEDIKSKTPYIGSSETDINGLTQKERVQIANFANDALKKQYNIIKKTGYDPTYYIDNGERPPTLIFKKPTQPVVYQERVYQPEISELQDLQMKMPVNISLPELHRQARPNRITMGRPLFPGGPQTDYYTPIDEAGNVANSEDFKTSQFAMGGSLPGSVGFMYARTHDPAPSEGPYAKKTEPSAENGTEMRFYQEGLDFKPKTISRDGSQLVKLDQLTNFTNYNTKQPGGWLDKYES